jgi:hypothetical protein
MLGFPAGRDVLLVPSVTKGCVLLLKRVGETLPFGLLAKDSAIIASDIIHKLPFHNAAIRADNLTHRRDGSSPVGAPWRRATQRNPRSSHNVDESPPHGLRTHGMPNSEKCELFPKLARSRLLCRGIYSLPTIISVAIRHWPPAGWSNIGGP